MMAHKRVHYVNLFGIVSFLFKVW